MKLSAIFVTLLVFGLVDLYTFKGLNGILQGAQPAYKWLFAISYWLISVAVILMLIYGIINRHDFASPSTLNFIIGVFITFLIPKLIFIIFHGIDDLYNLASFTVSKFSSTDYSRRNFITKTGLVASGIMLGSMVYGVLWGRFRFRVIRQDIGSASLPDAFDGVRIVHISDAHLGSFSTNYEPVKKAVQMINELNPDYVFFTGDMVNNHSDEAEPWIEVFSQIQASGGKYSVFGNHDYADYGSFTPEEKQYSINRLKEIHRKMGFRLLEDEHVKLVKGQETITLIGVHNWGKGFHQVGDLTKALEDTNPDDFQILLSHDPTHFEEQVKYKTSIDLTLSGHTHGMQMGIEVPSLGIKWSPVKFRYPRWAGLYQENGQNVYINRGFGVLAYPGRVGMAPEITLLTLRGSKA